MVEVRRHEKESVGSLLRRFSQKIQRSGILLRARSLAFRKRKKSKTRIRKEALRRLAARKRFLYLEKMGKIVERKPKRR